ncbi:TonB-dependent receptor [Phenylobacterium terrae]|uniref:TonB-dependent receptor n=1 Tax=Phenylobacterium terrae TaxID=2665495 RepID=A0ABW4N4G3_9CAUL
MPKKLSWTRRWMLMCATGASCLAGWSADAQPEADRATQIDEIIVTAQRRAESLQDVPISVTALGGDDIADAGLTSATDIVTQVPNLQAVNTFGNSTPQFTLRGVSNTEFNPSSNTPIPVYSDDLLLNNLAAQGFALFDLDRVEVLKGPQGTLFGYNASAGVIHFVSAQPTGAPEGRLHASYGSFNDRSVDGSMSGPIVGDWVRGRLAFTARDTDGHFKNLIDGEPLGEDERWAVRALVDVDLGENTLAQIKLQTGRFLGQPTMRPAEQELQPLTGQVLGGTYDLYSTTRQFERVRATELSLRLTHRFDGFDLNAVTGGVSTKTHLAFNYVDGVVQGVFDLGYGNGPVQTPYYGVQSGRAESDQFSQEVRLSSTTESPLQWIVGAFYMQEDLRSTGSFLFGDDSGAFGYLDGGAPAVFLVLDDYEQDIKSVAVFAHTTYQATERLKFTLAGRLSRDKRRLDQDFYNYDGFGTYIDPRTANPYDVRPDDVVDLTGVQNVKHDRTWEFWSGRVGVDYQVDPDKLLYASVSKGVKSGAFNTAAFIDVAEINAVDPEELVAYEAGAKTEWLDRRLRLNGSVFFYKVDGYHQKVVNEFGQELLQPAKDVEFRGFEIEARAIPVENLVLSLGAGWSEGEYKDFLSPNDAGGFDQLAGNTVPYTGRWDVSADISYSWLMPNGGLLEPMVEYSYLQGAFSEETNEPKDISLSPEAKTDDIHLVNARLFYTLPGDRIRIGVFANNLFEEDGVLRRTPLDIFGNTLSIYAPPRTAGVSIAARF